MANTVVVCYNVHGSCVLSFVLRRDNFYSNELNRFSVRKDGTLYPNMDGYYFYVYFEQDGSFILNVEYQQDHGKSQEYRFTAVCAENQKSADARYRQGLAYGIIP